MKKRVIALIVLILAIVLGVSYVYAKQAEKNEDISTATGFLSNLKELKELSDIMDLIGERFVGEKDIKKEELVQGAIKGMLEVLDDPHSTYFNKKDLNNFTQDIKGEYGGVGMVVTKQDGFLAVVSPIEDTPSAKLGMKPKDLILKIENESTQDLSVDQCVEKLKGKPGTKVKILVGRVGVEKPFEVTIERAVIKLKYVKYKMIDDKIGYLRLTQFGDNVGEQVRKAVEDLNKQNMKALIFDLRNNPGGALNEAINVSSIFIDKSPIVTVKEKDGKTDVYGPIGKAYTDMPLIVLINEGSASASEIVAGAVKDHKRGILLGEKSYGKGSVQTLIPLPEGDGLKLTIAKYYTPSGVCIHKIGIEPDVVVEEKEDGMFFEGFVMNVEENKIEQKKEPAKEPTKEGTQPADKKADKKEEVKEDVQLKQAINMLKGIEVFKNLQKK